MSQSRPPGNRAAVRAARASAQSGDDRPRGPRAQRTIAAMAFTMIGMAALAVIVLLVLTAAGTPEASFKSGFLLVLAVLPLPGLTIGLVLVVVLLVMGVVSRTRANRS